MNHIKDECLKLRRSFFSISPDSSHSNEAPSFSFPRMLGDSKRRSLQRSKKKKRTKTNKDVFAADHCDPNSGAGEILSTVTVVVSSGERRRPGASLSSMGFRQRRHGPLGSRKNKSEFNTGSNARQPQNRITRANGWGTLNGQLLGPPADVGAR